MDSYTHVRCLFCETGKEKQVVHVIHENDWGRAIFAQRVRFIRKEKEWEKVEGPLLPGYVFVYSNREDISNIAYQSIPHVIRMLVYENGIDQLTGSDRKFADWLWRINGEIGVIQTVQVGDRIKIADAMFGELHGEILRVNRRQKKIYVSLDTPSIPMHTWLAYEQIEEFKEGDK